MILSKLRLAQIFANSSELGIFINGIFVEIHIVATDGTKSLPRMQKINTNQNKSGMQHFSPGTVRIDYHCR